MLAWTAYLLVVSGIVTLVGLILERAFRPYHFATRWIWMCALFGPLVLPVLLSSTATRAAAVVKAQFVLKEASQNPAVAGRPPRTAQARTEVGGLDTTQLNTFVEGVWIGSSGIAAAVLFAGWCYGHRRRGRWRRVLVEGTELFVAEDAGPATVGLLHPQIVLPDWLLVGPPETLRLVLAHERSHVEARDTSVWGVGVAVLNLAPWNPFLWWQVGRLRLAIEADCDRRVLSGGHDARRYARTLVNVSTHRPVFLGSLAASSRSWSSIERRIMLMNVPRVHGWRASSAASALLALGIATTTVMVSPPAIPLVFADTASSGEPTDLSRYVGDYEFSAVTVSQVRLQHGQLTALGLPLTDASGQLFQWGDAKLNAHVRFATDAAGRVIGAVFEQNGESTIAPRIDAQRVRAIDAAISEHVRAQAPTSGSEEALRQLLAGIESGNPNQAAELSPQLAGGTRAMLADLQATMKPWGALRAVEFHGVDGDGWDKYLVRFERGSASWRIAVDPYGVIVGAETHPIDDSKP